MPLPHLNNMNSIFETTAEASAFNADYTRIANKKNNNFVKYREICEDLWSIYQPFSDPDFKELFATEFWPRLWEMYLTSALAQNYQIIEKHHSEGPDITLNLNGRRAFVEAVCPTGGKDVTSKSNRLRNKQVRQNYSLIFEKVESTSIELRIQSVIKDKMDKYNTYMKNCIITREDPYILGIALTRIPFAQSDYQELPWLLKSILPIGPEVSIIDMKTGLLSGNRVEFKPTNFKVNGSPVSKEIFASEEYADLSAIIFTRMDIPNSINGLNDEIFIVKNPFARNKIELPSLNEYTIEIFDEKINIDYRKNT